VGAYNLFTLLSALLSGLLTFLYVRRLSDSSAAGLVAGVIFAFCPYRMARIAGHLPLIDTQWIPPLLLCLDRFVERRRPLDAAGAGLAFAASALSSWYYGMALALLLPVYLYLRARRRERSAQRAPWLTGGLVFLAVATALVLPFTLPYLRVQRAGQARVPLEQAAFWSASLTDYMTPNPRHFLWGGWVRDNLMPFPDELPYEFLVGWGLAPTILALYGWRKSPARARAGWGWWIATALVLSLGPVFKLFGAAVGLPLPARWAETAQGILDALGWHGLAGETFLPASPGRLLVPLPALLLRWIVPGLAGMRAWGRFSILATFGVAVWAGIGTAVFTRDELASRAPRWRWVAPALLLATVAFEFYTGPQALIDTGPRAVDKWLAAQPTRSTIVQMPLAVALSGPQMYYSRYHNQRVASGYGTYLPILFEERFPALKGFPSPESLETLAAWEGGGVRYVLVDEADVPPVDPLWAAISAQERLAPAVILDGVHVYEVR
jgi:hypothetical protein